MIITRYNVVKERDVISHRLRVWLERDGYHVLGKGGAEILEAVEKHGSISSASKALGMSYRYVWGYIKRIEKATGKKVLMTKKGGRGGGEARLTSFGRELLREFKKLSDYVERMGDSYSDEWGLLGVKISARNRIKAKVKEVKIEGVAGSVVMEIVSPATIKALITADAIRDMDLKEGDEVFAIIKATEIMVAKRESVTEEEYDEDAKQEK